MICGKNFRETEQRPKCFSNLNLDEYKYRFLNCFYGGDIFGSVAFLITGEECLFHVELNHWSFGTGKTFIRGAFNEFFPYLKENGVRKLVAIKDGYDDEKWARFVGLLGFGKPINIMYTQRKL